MSGVTFSFRGLANRPPPFLDAIFDVSIVNTAAVPLWFAWPLYLDNRVELEPLLASTAQVIELKGRGVVRVAKFLGNGSSQVVRLAAGVTVVIKGLPITLLGLPETREVVLPILSADALRIGSQPAEQWFRVDLLSSGDADVTYEPGAIVSSQDTPDVVPLSIQVIGAKTQAIRVRLEPR